MLYLTILLAISICGLAYMRFEAGYLKIDRIAFTKSKNHLKILQISDIHIGHLKIPVEKVNKVIRAENPDLVIITGDFVEKRKQVEKALDFLARLHNNGNIYACLGNHDYEAFKKNEKELEKYLNDIKSRGIVLLHNKAVHFEKSGNKYNIVGIADIRYGHDDIDSALASCCKDAVMNIGFTHNPDLVLKFPRGKVDYLLSGHFHGGQIWMPFDLEFKLLRDEKLCKMGIKRGLHKINGVNLYINRGLGSVLFPFRFFSRPEITVFRLP